MEGRKIFHLPGIEPLPYTYYAIPALLAEGTEEKHKISQDNW
jgi:hypothetical protein